MNPARQSSFRRIARSIEALREGSKEKRSIPSGQIIRFLGGALPNGYRPVCWEGARWLVKESDLLAALIAIPHSVAA